MIIITGASSGIGAEFAKQLAFKKHDLLIIARNEDALIRLKKELSTHINRIEYLKHDLSLDHSYLAVLAFIKQKNLNISGLINCAGIAQQGSFDTQELRHGEQSIEVNITALIQLCHCIIPLLYTVKSPQEQPFIINVASTAAFQAGPKMAVYYASKAFVLSFTEALREELLDSNILVSCLCPGFTKSNFFTNSNMSDDKTFASGIMSAEKVVQTSLKYKHKAIVIPGIRNNIGAILSKILPRSITRKLAGKLQG
jgi:uncharacterized protein